MLCVDESPVALTSLLHGIVGTMTISTHCNTEVNSWGAAADGATTFDRALSMVGLAASLGTPYHLAIISYNIPHSSGLELARAVASEQTRVILLSSWLYRDAPELLAQHGVAATITKPFRREQLKHTVNQLFSVDASSYVERPSGDLSTVPAMPMRVLGMRCFLLCMGAYAT